MNATRPARWLLVAIVALMMGAGVWAPCPYDRQFREQIAAPPSQAHLLGTDAVGRDRFSRLLYGGRISLLLAPAAAFLSVFIALTIALGAALAGRWRETAATAFIDLFLSVPWLFLLLAVRAVLPLNATPGLSIAITFALLGLLGWPGPGAGFDCGSPRSVAVSLCVTRACIRMRTSAPGSHRDGTQPRADRMGAVLDDRSSLPVG